MIDGKKLRVFVQKFADKGIKRFHTALEEGDEKDELYWDGYSDCAESLLKVVDTLESEPKFNGGFKIGDRIRHKKDGDRQTIKNIHSDGILTNEFLKIKFKDLNEWELVEYPVTSVWHDASEIPEKLSDLIIYKKRDCEDSFYVGVYNPASNTVCINNRWYSLSTITKWAYVEDLLKL